MQRSFSNKLRSNQLDCSFLSSWSSLYTFYFKINVNRLCSGLKGSLAMNKNLGSCCILFTTKVHCPWIYFLLLFFHFFHFYLLSFTLLEYVVNIVKCQGVDCRCLLEIIHILMVHRSSLCGLVSHYKMSILRKPPEYEEI